VAFARWSDQLNCKSRINDVNIKRAIESVQKRKDFETFKLENVYFPEMVTSYNDLNAVCHALSTYEAVSLPVILVNPVLRQNEREPFPEIYPITLNTLARTDQSTPGCCICGGNEERLYRLTGLVNSEEVYYAIANMFANRGVSTIARKYFAPKNVFSESDISLATQILNGKKYPINIDACYDHRELLTSLRIDSVLHPNCINKEVIEMIIASNDRYEMFYASNVHEIRQNVKEGIETGFRLFSRLSNS
jgi:hypothetical protein